MFNALFLVQIRLPPKTYGWESPYKLKWNIKELTDGVIYDLQISILKADRV